MRIQWSGQARVAAPVERVYAYLADFHRHGEWSRSLLSIEQIAAGDGDGIGARFLAHEKVEFPATGWRSAFNRGTVGRTQSEVLELVPGRRIRWHAHTLPRAGTGAELTIELTADETGGTIVTQSIDERYPWPVFMLMRVLFNVTPEGARRQFAAGLQTMVEAIDADSAVPVS